MKNEVHQLFILSGDQNGVPQTLVLGGDGGVFRPLCHLATRLSL